MYLGSAARQYIADVDACLRLVACVGYYDGIIDGLTRCCDWVWTACLVFCDGQRWTLGHWCGGRVRGWAWYLRGGNTCCVYQIYTSIYVCLCGGVTDGVGPGFGNVQLAVATDAFGGPVTYLFHRPAIHRWRWCLSGFGCPCWSLRWYNWWSGPLLWLGLDRLSGLCNCQRWTLGHWCGGCVCGWAWHLRGRNTCCVYQIYASVDVGLRGGVTDGVGPGFGKTSSWPLLLMLSVGLSCTGSTTWQYIADVDACLVWLPVLVTTMV